MGLVLFKDKISEKENITKFPVVDEVIAVPVEVGNPVTFPANKFYLGSFDIFKTHVLKGIVLQNYRTDGATTYAPKWVNGQAMITENIIIRQMYITLVDFNNNVIVDHMPLSDLSYVQIFFGGVPGVYMEHHRFHCKIDPEQSFVNWVDNAITYTGTRILLLSCYMRKINK